MGKSYDIYFFPNFKQQRYMNFQKYTQTNKNELFPPTAGIKFIGEN
jgi:hypothetical protein